MPYTQPITSLGEILGDSSVIVFANGPIIGAWNRKAKVTMWDTMQKRSASEGGWGWTEYEKVAEVIPDDSDLGVLMDLAWAMDKAADWYEEHGEEY